ncbi:hypothetical protein KVT40_002700 [Elsinoe batatas]|uniref:Amino acid permease/ SLC12A domain-containing protein n=1 Tax=Elsinoe batatas TaxID=2601811 RepID=A0A8K0L4M5_9PEZI|nr:hypothetical protein KVT40_002700 [Elsinoe batatas]
MRLTERPTLAPGFPVEDRDSWEGDAFGSTAADRRNFKQLTSFSFSMILVATWETVFGVAGLSPTNGGTAGFKYMYILVWIFFLCIYTSMAELGSMAPTSGRQYQWVSELAPPDYQKQTSVASVSYLVATQTQCPIVHNHPTYVFARWHGTLLMLASSPPSTTPPGPQPFAFFPPAPGAALTPVAMNWSNLIFGVVCLWGGWTCDGPVKLVRRTE